MVFKALAEKDVVIHDVSLVGESEVAHQIDVRITSEGEERRILIECKDFDISGDKVGLDIVRNFFAVLEDTKVSEGMIITSRGFTSDAARYAKAKNIKLVVLRIHEEEDWAGFIRTIVANLMFISLPHTAEFNLYVDREEDRSRFQAELANLSSGRGVHINDPVYVVKDGIKHGFNDFFSAKMRTAIPFTNTPDRMTLRIESDGWRIQIGTGEPIPFTHIDASYEVLKDERTITVNSDRIAELIIKGFGDEDMVIFGDQLERRKIDPETGEVI